MIVSQLMSETVVTVHMDDTLAEVKAIFDNAHFHHLLVVEKDKLVGVISDRDFFKSVSHQLDTAAETQKDLASLNKRVHQIMNRTLTTIGPDADAYDAIDLFNNNKISCLPVLDQDGKPVGILSWRDILKVMKKKR
jgi:acetoin utilization protein AcuB